jgi:hypothetical protein
MPLMAVPSPSTGSTSTIFSSVSLSLKFSGWVRLA